MTKSLSQENLNRIIEEEEVAAAAEETAANSKETTPVEEWGVDEWVARS